MGEIMDDYDAGFQDGKNDLALDLVNHFNKKIEELKSTDELSRNAHISALETFVKTIHENLNNEKSKRSR